MTISSVNGGEYVTGRRRLCRNNDLNDLENRTEEQHHSATRMRRLSTDCKLVEVFVSVIATDVVGKPGFSNSDDAWVEACAASLNRGQVFLTERVLHMSSLADRLVP